MEPKTASVLAAARYFENILFSSKAKMVAENSNRPAFTRQQLISKYKPMDPPEFDYLLAKQMGILSKRTIEPQFISIPDIQPKMIFYAQKRPQNYPQISPITAPAPEDKMAIFSFVTAFCGLDVEKTHWHYLIAASETEKLRIIQGPLNASQMDDLWKSGKLGNPGHGEKCSVYCAEIAMIDAKTNDYNGEGVEEKNFVSIELLKSASAFKKVKKREVKAGKAPIAVVEAQKKAAAEEKKVAAEEKKAATEEKKATAVPAKPAIIAPPLEKREPVPANSNVKIVNPDDDSEKPQFPVMVVTKKKKGKKQEVDLAVLGAYIDKPKVDTEEQWGTESKK